MKKYVKSSTTNKKEFLTSVFQSVMDLEDKLEYLWKNIMDNDKDSKLVKQSLNMYTELMRYNDYVVEEINKKELES